MMKAGRIVDRGSPQALIARYGRANLEEVFLHIARRSRARAGAGIVTRAGRAGIGFSPGRVWAMLLRYLYLLRSSWPRTLELVVLADLADADLGVHEPVSLCQQQLRVARLWRAAGRGDAVGCLVPRPARPVDLVSRGDVGAQPRAPVRHPAAPLRMGRLAVGDEPDPRVDRRRPGGAAGDPALPLFDLYAGTAACRVFSPCCWSWAGRWGWRSAG